MHGIDLQSRLDRAGRDLRAQLPPRAFPAFERGTQAALAAGLTARSVQVGDVIAPFRLPDTDSRWWRSSELLESGPLLIVFARGVWCPYCNIEMRAIEAVIPEITALGASVVAITPQSVAYCRSSKAINELSYLVLSDTGADVAHSFGVGWSVPDYIQDVYLEIGTILTDYNDDGGWRLPMPARFVITPFGEVVYAEVHPDYTRRPDPAELLPALRGLAQATRST